VAKAREGVKIRVIYDWFGSLSLLGSGCGTPAGRRGLLGWTGFFILVEAIRIPYGNQDKEAENMEPKKKVSSNKGP
jgi:hypothetical protein